MRLFKVALVSSLFVLLTVTVLPQEQNTSLPAVQQEAVDKAHVDMLKATTDKAVEAGRLTDAVSGSLPQTAVSSAPISRRNYIDEHIFGRMQRDGIPHAPLAGDAEFVRRVYLDLTGLLPEPTEVREFIASNDPDKRDKLIDSLIGNDQFAEQWAWLWGDLFQTESASFSYWFKKGLKLDRPYNETAKEILSNGTMKTIGNNPAWRVTFAPHLVTLRTIVNTDADNYYAMNRLDFLDAVAVTFGRVFMGINMDCISCHNGAGHLESVNLYLAGKKRSEFAQQAAFWARQNVVPQGTGAGSPLVNDDNPGYRTGDDAPFYTPAESRFPRDGKTYEPAFILTGETPRAGMDPKKELGRLVTNHIQFSRATVNILWGKLMTVGFVEPYDGFDLARMDPNNPPPQPWTIQPTNPALLEAMAKDFQANNYSLHHLFKTIMKSSAYQLSTQFPGEWKDSYSPYYARRYARVMTGPEVADTVAQATGQPYDFNWAGDKVTRVKQLSDPFQVNPPGGRIDGNDLGVLGTIEGNSIKAIMQSFFQSTRDSPAMLTNRPSAVQAMLIMTAPSVANRVFAKEGTRLKRLLDSGKSDAEIIEEMFLATLARAPKPAETEVALRILHEGDRKKQTENLQWALLNSVEFLLNH